MINPDEPLSRSADSRTDKIAEALAKAQKDFAPVQKSGVNTHFKNTYAKLIDVLSAVIPALSANGIAVSQPIRLMGDKTPWIYTELLHSSGQKLVSVCPLDFKENSMQSLGSAITYARRYSLESICGVSGDDDADDDGVGADGLNKGKSGEKPKQKVQPKAQEKKNDASPQDPLLITKDQQTRLWTLAGLNSKSENDVRAIIKIYKYESTGSIKKTDYDSIINEIQK